MRLFEHARFFLVARLDQTGGLAFAQQVQRLTQYGSDELAFLVALRRLLLRGGNPLFERFKVGEHQLGLDRLCIRNRINPVINMLDVVILETSQHMDDGIHLADIAKELVA